jgi:hypothetical protein
MFKSATKYAELVKLKAEIPKAKGERDQRMRRLVDQQDRLRAENQAFQVMAKQTRQHLEKKGELTEQLAASKHYQSMRLFIAVARMEQAFEDCRAQIE